eukprot:TRINITY_DN66179_c0_g1_i1.p1 TRINITY_DN66179_c0_g1~~TRINITY_DN66179_c0_g1_i1.p1  ORF type:complete len:587 (+),score=126.00 TRINITY_DN66179_c0_g1_i1:100-1860(+)
MSTSTALKYKDKELLQGLGEITKQAFFKAHPTGELGMIQSWMWSALMALAAVKRAELFVEFTVVQAGSQTAIQRFHKHAFWKNRRRMLLVILKTAAAVVVQEFAAGRLKILWRKVATASAFRYYLGRDATFYHMKLEGAVDNPEHRITSDVKTIVDYIVELAKVVPEHLVKFLGLTRIMWQTSPFACFLLWTYAGAGTVLTRKGFESQLARHELTTQALEAHIRFALVRISECAEGIAFYRAGASEENRLLASLSRLVSAQRRLLAWSSAFHAFQEVYSRVATMLPSLITAPLFWQHHIEFGAISKMFTAFRSVKEILLFLSTNYDKLASITARLDRLEALRRFPQERQALKEGCKIHLGTAAAGDALLSLREVRVAVPCSAKGARRWLGDSAGVSYELNRGGALLIQGESGVGKSSLLRAIAGLWNEGTGDILRSETVLFLPQTPYLPSGEDGVCTSIREQLLYPGDGAAAETTDEMMRDALEAVDLAHLAVALSEKLDWATVLSGGEKQRVVFARLLVQLRAMQGPALVLLDEATSACSESMEAKLYDALLPRLSLGGGALVSVGHRSSLRRYHAEELLLVRAQ